MEGSIWLVPVWIGKCVLGVRPVDVTLNTDDTGAELIIVAACAANGCKASAEGQGRTGEIAVLVVDRGVVETSAGSHANIEAGPVVGRIHGVELRPRSQISGGIPTGTKPPEAIMELGQARLP